jgi:hypothetical protein
MREATRYNELIVKMKLGLEGPFLLLGSAPT